jgi:hypothetical protein
MSNEQFFKKYAVDSEGQIYEVYGAASMTPRDPTFIQALEKNKTTLALFDVIIFGCLWVIFGNGYLKRRRKEEENG